nr:hypothetical protein [Moorella mulderi]
MRQIAFTGPPPRSLFRAPGRHLQAVDVPLVVDRFPFVRQPGEGPQDQPGPTQDRRPAVGLYVPPPAEPGQGGEAAAGPGQLAQGVPGPAEERCA